MIAACYSNPNWDGKDNAEKRKEYLKELNDHFNRAITKIYFPTLKAQEVDWDNPFFSAHRREMERTRELFGLEDGDKPVGELVEAEQEQQSNGRPRWEDFDQFQPDEEGR